MSRPLFPYLLTRSRGGNAMTDVNQPVPTNEALETMVAEADTGGRKPTGFGKSYIFVISLGWSLFQLWYASPLPYKLNFGVVNDGQARIVHLSFAFLLAFATFPAFKSSPRKSDSPHRLGSRCTRCRGRDVLVVLLPGHFVAAGIADDG